MRSGRRKFLGAVGGVGAGLIVGCGLEVGLEDGGFDAGRPPRIDAGPRPGLSKPPYVQLVGPQRARLRFETRLDHAAVVRVSVDGSAPVSHDPTRSAVDLDYARPALSARVIADDPGLHVLHEVLLEELPPGAEVSWVVEPPDADPIEGRLRAPAASGQPFRVGWLADTMQLGELSAARSAEVLAAQRPDVALHGGDITYWTNPLDTWNGITAALAPLTALTPLHFIVGNHELEAMDEVTLQYDRLYGGQGDPGAAVRYFAYTYGGVRFVCIDTESGGLREMDSAQLAWLDAELARVDDDPDLRFAVVGFHRPTYTLSRHAPSSTEVRELLHARFVAHRVPLVLSGHVHAYERFAVDGVTYWIDGGAGAVLYDPDQDRDEVEAMRPGESALRQAVSRSHGVTTIDVDEDGLTVRRLANEDAGVQDEVRIDV